MNDSEVYTGNTDEIHRKNTVTALTEEQIKLILDKFDVGSYKSIERIPGGLANSNYKLETDRGFFLFKVCDEKTYESLLLQVHFLLQVRAYNFVTAFPHPLKGKPLDKPESYVYNEKSIRVIIYDFLNGSPKKFKEVTPLVMEQLGKSLANLHLIPRIPNLGVIPQGIESMEAFLEEVKSTHCANHPFVTSLRKSLEALKPDITNPELPYGMLHADLFPDNCLFDGEKLVAIVDWEEVSVGPLMFDVTTTILGCCFPNDNKLDKTLMDAFLSAYQSVRPLTELENKVISQFFDYTAYSLAFWRFRQFHLRNPDPILQDKYKEMEDRVGCYNKL